MFDLKSLVALGVSLCQAITGSSLVEGTGVDAEGHNGPVFGIFNTGSLGGTAQSQSFACKLMECDTSGGTYTDITGATATLSADKTAVIVRGIRTKRYVKAAATPTYVSGSSPTNIVTGVIAGCKQTF